jgi:hypothetical protein
MCTAMGYKKWMYKALYGVLVGSVVVQMLFLGYYKGELARRKGIGFVCAEASTVVDLKLRYASEMRRRGQYDRATLFDADAQVVGQMLAYDKPWPVSEAPSENEINIAKAFQSEAAREAYMVLLRLKYPEWEPNP